MKTYLEALHASTKGTMPSFKQFFERDDSLAIAVTSSDSLSDFMKSLAGKSIKEILDSSSFIRMYQMNKYGIGGRAPDNEEVMGRFIDLLGNFINRDIKKAVAMRKAIFSDEFKAENNFDEYEKLDALRKVAVRKFFNAKKEAGWDGDSPEVKKLRDILDAEKEEISQQISQNEFYRAWQKREREITQWVKDFHNTPLSHEDVAPDDSMEWMKVQKAWDAMQQSKPAEEPQDSRPADQADVIDV